MKKYLTFFSIFILIITSCSKSSENEHSVVLSAKNEILSFKLVIDGQLISGLIDEPQKKITFTTVGAELALNSIIPQIEYSNKANIFPAESAAQNFNNVVEYTVTAENGNESFYTVLIGNRPKGTESKILTFSVIVDGDLVNADINEDLKSITFNTGDFNISSLTPDITISEYASVSPQIGEAVNFENEIIYTVTAENDDETNYIVYVNFPKINSIASKIGVFTNMPALFYTRADIALTGQFLDLTLPETQLYLSDGVNSYTLIVSETDTYVNELVIEYYLTTEIPEDVVTGSNYKVYFKRGSFISESETYVDILAEGSPLPLSLNQDIFVRGDTLLLSGVDLTDEIAIPSNGNQYIISNNYYDFEVNEERTEINLFLSHSDAGILFPSYYGRPAEEKYITPLGPDRRAGKTIAAIFD